MEKWDNQKTRNLIKAVLSLKNANEAKKFFRDLMTEKEIIEFGNRFQAARMLDEGISYTSIEKETGLSSTTVARVSKWLCKGKGGYRLVLNKLNHHNSSLPGKELC
jgi:TrpR-related protein YerC/YecD